MSLAITKNSKIISNNIIEKSGDPCFSQYIKLDYIQSDGVAIIDTGYADGLLVTVDCHMYVTSATGNYWFGSTQAHGAMMYNGAYNNTALEYNWLTITRTANNDLIMTQRIVDSNTVITMNGVTYTVATGTDAPSGNMYIFGCNAGARDYDYPIRCYYFKIYNNNVLVRDFIPVKRKSDNAVGLLDLINNVFYDNCAESGTLTAGNELLTDSCIYAADIMEV